MSGIHKDGVGWNALGVWCGECLTDTCEGCPYEFKREEAEKEDEPILRKEVYGEEF